MSDADHTLTLRDPDNDAERCENCLKHISDCDNTRMPDDCQCTRCVDCRELLDEEEERLDGGGVGQCFDCFVNERDHG